MPLKNSPVIVKPVKLVMPTEDNCSGSVRIRPALPSGVAGLTGDVKLKLALVDTGLPANVFVESFVT